MGTLHRGLWRRHPITPQNLRERQRLSRVQSGTSMATLIERSRIPTGLPPLPHRQREAFPTREQGYFPPRSFSPDARMMQDIAEMCPLVSGGFSRCLCCCRCYFLTSARRSRIPFRKWIKEFGSGSRRCTGGLQTLEKNET